jgi:hypothetical protein
VCPGMGLCTPRLDAAANLADQGGRADLCDPVHDRPAATHVSSAVSEPCSEAATHPPDRQLGEGGDQQQPPPGFSSGGDGGHDPEGGR